MLAVFAVGETVTIIASSPQMDKISQDYPLYLSLLDSEGSVLEQVELTECRGILSGIVAFPSTSLVFYQLQGHDIGANPFTHTLLDQEVNLKPVIYPLKITFVKDSPKVTSNSVTAFLQTDQRVSDMQCKIFPTKEVKNCECEFFTHTHIYWHAI